MDIHFGQHFSHICRTYYLTYRLRCSNDIHFFSFLELGLNFERHFLKQGYLIGSNHIIMIYIIIIVTTHFPTNIWASIFPNREGQKTFMAWESSKWTAFWRELVEKKISKRPLLTITYQHNICDSEHRMSNAQFFWPKFVFRGQNT